MVQTKFSTINLEKERKEAIKHLVNSTSLLIFSSPFLYWIRFHLRLLSISQITPLGFLLMAKPLDYLPKQPIVCHSLFAMFGTSPKIPPTSVAVRKKNQFGSYWFLMCYWWHLDGKVCDTKQRKEKIGIVISHFKFYCRGKLLSLSI